MKERKVILYISSSLDGFIAKPGDDLSFLDIAQKEGEDYGYQQFVSTVDTILVGRRTYDWVLEHAEYPHTGKQSYVITRTPQPPQEDVEFYTGDLKELIQELKELPGKHIYCDGGAELVNSLLREDLMDELILFVMPVLVGDGIRLFQENRPEQQMELLSAKSYDTGVVRLHYRWKRDRGF